MKKLRERAALLQAVRSFFYGRDYLEVETPIRQPVLIPEAEIMQVASGEWFLQTSPELAMKRLLAQGEERIWQICKCFRGQERGARHLPEFTMLEWYRLHGDYCSLMTETEEMLVAVATELRARAGFDHDLCARMINSSWQRLTVAEAFHRHAGVVAAQCVDNGSFDEVLVTQVEPQLGHGQPCFLYDYPAKLGSLARLKAGDANIAERFELYIAGMEIANGFSELTDAQEQRQRFLAEVGGDGPEKKKLPERFLEDLATIPAACGIALGLDRLLMILTAATTIAQVVSFTPEEL